MRESFLYKKLKDNQVQCQTCAHYCVLGLQERGKCGVRENIDGKLLVLNDNKVITVHLDPIEKKPLFHFLPASQSLSLATVGCNFSCLNCQNYDLSQGFKRKKEIPGETISPSEIIQQALERKTPSISYTYTEPTIFLELALETMKLAKENEIKNLWVSNGFFSKETFKLVAPYLDAVNIDLKGFTEKFYQEVCGGRLQPVLDNLKRIKEKNIWLEITTLIIPTLSDDLEMLREIAAFIKNELGEETPWHISRFSGAISWQLKDLPETPIAVIEDVCQIGKKAGLKYVYAGNLPDSEWENTYCPACNALAIKRGFYRIERYDRGGKCPQCKADLNIFG